MKNRERNRILSYVLFLVFIVGINWFFHRSDSPSTQVVVHQLKEDKKSLHWKQSEDIQEKNKDNFSPAKTARGFQEKSSSNTQVFSLDLNRPDSAQFIKSGMSKYTFRNMRKFQAAGAILSDAGDLAKVYGVQEKWMQNHGANVVYQEDKKKFVQKKIVAKSWDEPRDFAKPSSSSEYSMDSWAISLKDQIVNINQADSTEWMSLKGVGPFYAKRILKFRQSLGGFQSIDQVKETYGLPDSVFQLIRPLLNLTKAPSRIDIHNASIEDLSKHPYLSYTEAKKIKKYLETNGLAANMQDLTRIYGIDRDKLRKMEPYLDFGETVAHASLE